MLSSSDNGFVVGGPYGKTLRIDSARNDLWCESFGNGDIIWARALAGGAILLAMAAYENIAGTWYPNFILNVDINGNLLWSKNYQECGTWKAASVDVVPGGGYILAGYTTSWGSGGKDMALVRIDEDGAVMWKRGYGSIRDEQAVAVRCASDGGFILGGYYLDVELLTTEAYIIKTDSQGNAPPFPD